MVGISLSTNYRKIENSGPESVVLVSFPASINAIADYLFKFPVLYLKFPVPFNRITTRNIRKLGGN